MKPSLPESPATIHAPPERLPAEAIREQSAALGDLSGLAALLDCMPRGRSTLLCGSADCGKTLFAMGGPGQGATFALELPITA